MDEATTRLAKEFAFPAYTVLEIRWSLAFVADILCYQPERKTLREREREARRRLRADLNDKDARDELRSVFAGRRSVVVDATRTEMVDGEPKYVRYETRNNNNGSPGIMSTIESMRPHTSSQLYGRRATDLPRFMTGPAAKRAGDRTLPA